MTRKLRVAFIGTFSSTAVNGVENSGFYLAQELVRQHVEVFFYAVGRQTMHFTDEHEIHHRVFARHRFSFWLPREFRQLLHVNPDDIDIFHLHSVFIPRHFMISYLLREHDVPYVITPHGGYIRKALERTLRQHRAAKSLYIHLIERSITNHAGAMIVALAEEAEDLRRFGYRGPVYVIPNPNPPVAIGSAFNEPKEQQTILFLGRYDITHKGLLFLLDTFRHLAEKFPKLQLILHGSGPHKLLLEKKIHAEKIPRVTIGDPVYGSDKDRVLRQCTLYCQPSQFEAFGLSIVEAMLSGKPVALTEGCYIASTLQKHGLGLIIPLDARVAAEAIGNFLANPDELVRQGSALRELALREFDVVKVVDQTINVYRSVLSKSAVLSHVVSGFNLTY